MLDRIANFDDLDPLRQEGEVEVILVERTLTSVSPDAECPALPFHMPSPRTLGSPIVDSEDVSTCAVSSGPDGAASHVKRSSFVRTRTSPSGPRTHVRWPSVNAERQE